MQTLRLHASSPPASRVRWHILLLLGVIAALTYLDRLNLSIAGKYIQDEFGFSTETMGWILSALVLGYALFQVPGGWLGDRLGPRGVLTAAILFWSAMTAATALAPRLPLAQWFGVAWSFALVRFLVGLGEGTVFPNISRMTAYWMRARERGMASSLWLVGIGAGGIVTPLLVGHVSERWGWRASFYVCAAIGLGIAFAWRLYATNHPEDHPRVNAAELELIRAGRTAPSDNVLDAPWRTILSSFSAVGLILSYFCIAYPAYVFYTWFFIYLVRVRGLSVAQGSVGGAAPFIAIALLAPLGGWISDRAVARLGRRRGRQLAVTVGATASALLMWAGGRTANNTAAILLLAGSAGFNLFATATWWAASNDMTRRHAGTLSGWMNMSGNLGGWLCPIVTGAIAARVGWEQALDFAAIVTVSASIFWIFIDAGHDLDG
jgi:ACS family glucarate transporter-like MFS transporter